jgi:hypothetical protein
VGWECGSNQRRFTGLPRSGEGDDRVIGGIADQLGCQQLGFHFANLRSNRQSVKLRFGRQEIQGGPTIAASRKRNAQAVVLSTLEGLWIQQVKWVDDGQIFKGLPDFCRTHQLAA